jgi:hypothetical protein
MIWVSLVVMRSPTTSYAFLFPLIIVTTQHVMELHPKLLEGPLEGLLSQKNPMILLHHLEEVRSIQPQHLHQFLGLASLTLP